MRFPAVFPASAFPLTIELLDAATLEPVWKQTMAGPGAIWVPGSEELGCKRRECRITFADGDVMESWHD